MHGFFFTEKIAPIRTYRFGRLKTTKPAQVNLAGFLGFNPQLCCASCGTGGIRTLVQTRNTITFYTLSFLLVFVTTPGKNTQSCP